MSKKHKKDELMNLKINDVIDVQANQQLLDSFCESVGIAAAIIDLEGVVIIGSNWQKICTEFHRVNERTRCLCIESDTTLANLLEKGNKYSLYKCKLGIYDAASPIIVEGEHIANAFVGQFFIEQPDYEYFKQQADIYGFDKDKYLEYLSKVPVFSKDQIPKIVNFIVSYAQLLAGIALKHQKQIKSEIELAKAEKEIEERKKYESIINEKNQKLELSNNELEQFAYVASHDLQEPLRMVASYTELLDENYSDKLDEKAKRYINYAVDGARRMQQLINDLLMLSRVKSQGKKFEVIDTDELVNSVVQEIGKYLEEKSAFVEISSLPSIHGDRNQIFQLFQNLIINGIKFNDSQKPTVKISACQKDRKCIFSIEDNGIGIEEKYFDKIFTIFQRLHNRSSYEGTGIGLAMVKKIVDRHDGDIWLESKKNSGTIFNFTLDLA